MTLYALRGGTRHIWDLEPLGMDNLIKTRMLNWSGQAMVILGVGAGKVSVSALLLSILRHTHLQWQRIYLWTVTIVLTLLIAISCAVLTIAQCSPPWKLWDHRVQDHCIDPHVMASYGMLTSCESTPSRASTWYAFLTRTGFLAEPAFNTFADASLAVIPATLFWDLSASRFERVQLSIVFSLNILTSLCSGIKTPLLKGLADREDITWATFEVFAWVTAELFLMIICGTLPALHPMLTLIRSAGQRLSDRLHPGAREQGRYSDGKSSWQGNTGCELTTLKNTKTNVTVDTVETGVTFGNESQRRMIVKEEGSGSMHGAPEESASSSWVRWTGTPRCSDKPN